METNRYDIRYLDGSGVTTHVMCAPDAGTRGHTTVTYRSSED